MSGTVSKNGGRASGIVGVGAIGADAVDSENIADDAIDSEHYAATSIDTAHIATNQIDETLMKDAFVGDFTDATVTASDYFLHGDATDSGNTKKDTVQGVIDLVHGATAGIQTIWIPAAAMRPNETNGCAAITTSETTSQKPDLHVLDFDGGSTEEGAQFQIMFPKSWNEGTITFRVVWTSTATDTDGVSWGLEGVACGDGDTIDATYGSSVTVDDLNQSTAEDMYFTPESTAVTINGTPAADQICFFRIFRDIADVNDTAAEDARLIGVRILFTTNAENDD